MFQDAQDTIRNWWRAFVAQAPRIRALFTGSEKWDLPAWMHEHLRVIHPDLVWEFGPAVHHSGHRLVITPELHRHLRPLVREILRQAPPLHDWEFYEYRLPEDFEQAKLAVEGRSGGDIAEVYVHANRGRFNLIDLEFVSERFATRTDDALNDVFVAAESLLGEEMLDCWVGAIEATHAFAGSSGELHHIRDLRELIAQHVEAVCASLPQRPLLAMDLEEMQWSAIERQPKESDDYAEQDDLFAAITPFADLWLNFLNGIPFDSRRWSRCGERFCYLKIDGTQGLEGSRFADRAEIEEAINACLRPHSLGCTIGGGTGVCYSYIELALLDVERAWSAIRDEFQPPDLPVRTWLLFHDADLRACWRALSSNSPPPRLPSFD